VVAVAVGGAVGFGRVPDCIAECLGDADAGFVLPGCNGTHAGAATVDAEGGDGGVEKGGEVDKGGEGGG